MSDWNFDITNIPRGRTEMQTRIVKGKPQEYEVFIPERVLIAHPRDGRVYATIWIEPNKFCPKGRWSGWTEGTEPVAWQHYPDHPFRKMADIAETALNERHEGERA